MSLDLMLKILSKGEKTSLKQKEEKTVLIWLIHALPFHLKDFVKAEGSCACGPLRHEKMENFLFWATPKKQSHFAFFLVRQENEKAIIHAVLINHPFTSCL